jgi:formate dehydrogenase subunit gamma
MGKRLLIWAVAAGAFVLGIVYAWRVAYVDGTELLFDSAWWLVVAAPLVGILAAGLTRRTDPVIEGDRVLRHDGPAMLEHWTHGIGTVALLVTGLALGAFFIPTFLSTQQLWAAMNIHFVAVVVFLFGTFYYGANTLLGMTRFKEHLPTKNALDYTKRHYGRLLGNKEYDMPPEAKYFESEKIAFLLALASTALIIVTGLIKVAAHIFDVPGWVMAVTTPTHDIAMVAMGVFFLAHVLFAAILPMGWPMLRSMFTGYVPLEYAKSEHAGWLAGLEGRKPSSGDSAS